MMLAWAADRSSALKRSGNTQKPGPVVSSSTARSVSLASARVAEARKPAERARSGGGRADSRAEGGVGEEEENDRDAEVEPRRGP
jgi:hypothetical protein